MQCAHSGIESVFGQDSAQANAAKESLGDVLASSGNQLESERYYREILDGQGTGGMEKGCLTSKLSKTLLYRSPTGYQEALQIMENSLNQMQGEGIDRNTIAAQMQQYATLMQNRGDMGKAQDFLTRAGQMRTTGILQPSRNGGHYAGLYPPGNPEGNSGG